MFKKIAFGLLLVLLLALAVPLLFWLWGVAWNPLLLWQISLSVVIVAGLGLLAYWGYAELHREQKMKDSGFLR